MKLISKYLLLAFALLTLSVGCDSDDDSSSGDGTELVLTPSSSFIVVSTSSIIEFTATYNGKDVSNSSDLMVLQKSTSDSDLLSDNTYTVSRAGTYTFYAIYGNYMSDEITVTGITNLPDAAADSAPDQFDSFSKRAMAVLATGTWCQYCPYLIDVIHDYTSLNDDLVACEAHYRDTMTSTGAGYVTTKLSTASYPTLYMGLSTKSTLSTDATVATLTTAVKSELSTAAGTAISANTSYEDSVVCVRADVKVSEGGQYRIGAFLLEDDVYGEQTNAFDDWMNYHDNVIAAIYPESISLTETLGGVSVQDAKSTHLFYCEFDFSTLTTVTNRTNCRVVIFTYDNSALVVDNVVEVELGGSISYQYE
ncbi:MAG: Omp28-related outer membrane protein [Rikenellaceae bacterium]